MFTLGDITIEEIVEELADLDDVDRVRQLEEWGRTLPRLADDQKTEANKVHGCQSQVWLVAHCTSEPNPVVTFLANSDAAIVNALIFLLRTLLSGKRAREILDIDARAFFERIGLERQIGAQRKNGLNAMYQRIRTIAAAALELQQAPALDRGPRPTLPAARARSLDAIRADFPILQRPLTDDGRPLTYLDSGASAQKPRAVIEREREVYETFYANAYRGVYRFGAQIDEALELTRNKVAELIHAASTDEIVFTSGSTMSLNMIAFGWGRRHLRTGDDILLNDMEHHANLVPWQQVARQTGAVCRFIPLTADGRLDLARLDDVLTPRTRIVTVTGMSNVLGTINPVRELAARAHAVGAVLVVDGAQSVPHLPIDVVAADVDFLAFSGHKLYGPSGIGVLYGKQARLEETDPLLFGGHMIDRVYRDQATWAAPPARFEAGTLPIVQAIGLGAAIDYVAEIGLPTLHELERQLGEYTWQQLHQVPGLRVYGPPLEHRGGIFSFTLDGVHPEDLAQRLDRRGVFVRHGHHCTMPLHDWLGVAATVRVSLAVYNTRDDIDRLIAALLESRV